MNILGQRAVRASLSCSDNGSFDVWWCLFYFVEIEQETEKGIGRWSTIGRTGFLPCVPHYAFSAPSLRCVLQLCTQIITMKQCSVSSVCGTVLVTSVLALFWSSPWTPQTTVMLDQFLLGKGLPLAYEWHDTGLELSALLPILLKARHKSKASPGSHWQVLCMGSRGTVLSPKGANVNEIVINESFNRAIWQGMGEWQFLNLIPEMHTVGSSWLSMNILKMNSLIT